MHTLNLCLVDSTKAICEASEFFASLETLYVLLSSSKYHSLFMQQQREIYPDKQLRQLQRLSAPGGLAVTVLLMLCVALLMQSLVP